MNLTEMENAKHGAETLDVFLTQFNLDEHSVIVLQYIFELLYNSKEVPNEENIFVSGS